MSAQDITPNLAARGEKPPEDAKGRESGLRLSIVVAYKPEGPEDPDPFEAVCPELDLVDCGSSAASAAANMGSCISAHLSFAEDRGLDPFQGIDTFEGAV